MTSVPTKAVWVDGNKGKGKVLIDMASGSATRRRMEARSISFAPGKKTPSAWSLSPLILSQT